MGYLIISYKMPRLAMDYSKTVMYKLVCKDLTVKWTYVGHTTDFTKRKQCHKSSCNKETGKAYNRKVYTTIRTNGGWDNWSMVLIENYPCENKQQAEQRERFWYEELNAQLNMIRPHLTTEEYKNRNKEYRENNLEKELQRHREYKQANKEKLNKQAREKYALKKQLSSQ